MTSIWREVGDRVWVRRYASLDQTIGVIGGADGLVVIDTRATHPLADELRTDLRALGRHPNAPAPAFGDSYPIAWVETGRALLAMVQGVVVPGHGDPFDRRFAEDQVEQLAALAELAGDAAGGAIGLDDAIRRSPFPAEPTATALERVRLELE